MPSREQLEIALRNADKAGANEDATQLANALRDLGPVDNTMVTSASSGLEINPESIPTDIPIPGSNANLGGVGFLLKKANEQPAFAGRLTGDVTGGLVGDAVARSALGRVPGGNLLARPLGRAVARTGISSALSGLGSSLGDLWDQARDAIRGNKEIDLDFGRARDAGVEDASFALGGQAVGELVGAGKRALFNHNVSPEVEAADTALKNTGVPGAGLRLGQRKESQLLLDAESATASGLFGGKRIRESRAANEDAVQLLMDNLVTKVSGDIEKLTPGQRGQVIFDAISDGESAFKAATSEGYASIDRKVSEAIGDANPNVVNITAVKEASKKAQARLFLKPGAAKRITSKLSKEPDQVTFARAQQIRSDILGELRDAAATPGQKNKTGKMRLVVNEISRTMDDTLMKTAEDLGVADDLLAVNKQFKEGKKKFNNKLLQRQITRLENNPESIVQILNTGGPNVAKVLKRSVNKKAWKQVQGALLQSHVEKGPGGLISYIESAKGDRTFSRIFDKSHRDDLEKLANVIVKSQQQGSGSVGLKWKQFSAIESSGRGAQIASAAGAWSLIHPLLAAPILLGPPVFARIAADPVMVRRLTQVARANSRTPVSVRVFTQIATFADEVEKELR